MEIQFVCLVVCMFVNTLNCNNTENKIKKWES